MKPRLPASSIDPHAYEAWLDHIWPAAGCTHPIRLGGQIHRVDPGTGEVTSTLPTSALPDGIIYKACGNRRTSACPSCAETYRRDAFQLIRAGLIGGKGIPEHVAESSGRVRHLHRPLLRPRPFTVCPVAHLHRQGSLPLLSRSLATPAARLRCARTAASWPASPAIARDDARLGQPLCPDCYGHTAHVVWNNSAGELWRRTKQAIERHLNQLARHRGIPALRPVPAGRPRQPRQSRRIPGPRRGPLPRPAPPRRPGRRTTPPGCCPRPPASPPPTSTTPPGTPPPLSPHHPAPPRQPRRAG